MILDEIVAHKQQVVNQAKSRETKEELNTAAKQAPPLRNFRAALTSGGMDLIAEVKKASPSKGVIREDFKPVAIAQQYQQAGANALSVLTDQKFFQGKLAYIAGIKEAVELPILRKDFIIDPYQIYQARAYGADAILLIAAILEPEEAEYYLQLARQLGLDVLLEVHNQSELKTALQIGADIIGINNRDLTVFDVDLQTTIQLQQEIPEDKVIVSESGIQEQTDIELLADNNVDAVLIGEALMRADDIKGKIGNLFKVN